MSEEGSSEGGGRGRGRARSRTYSSDDPHFLSELSSAAGLPPAPAPAPQQQPAAPAPSPRAATGGVSQRTIKTLTNLEVALGKADGGGDEEDAVGGGGGGAAQGGQQRRSEEEEAEAELVEQERRRRAGEVGGGGGGGGAGGSASAAAAASAPAGAGSAAGGGGGGGGRRGKGADQQSHDVQVKLLLLGDSGVGKTSLMLRYSEDKFSPMMVSTAGVDYKTASLDVEGRRVKCQIWDTAGQQRFHVITHSYYKNAHGIVLVYDVSETTEASFANVQYWMENIKKHASPSTHKLLIGNKIDAKGTKIATERGRAVAAQFGMRFVETSAFDGTNVREAFSGLAREVVEGMIASGLAPAGAGGAAAGAGAAAAAAAPAAAAKKECAIM